MKENLGLNSDNCLLFKGFKKDEIHKIITSPKIIIQDFTKGQYIFHQEDLPQYLYVLVKGAVTVGKDDINGKRTIVNTFKDKGTVFAEVYLYLIKRAYDYSCNCLENTKVLSIPKGFIIGSEGFYGPVERKLNENMLTILSEKAFHLNQKLLIQSSYTLRQKIANYLLQQDIVDDQVILPFTREELANYIVTTRPSLSRELSSMEEDGLIKVNRSKIELKNMDELRNLL